MNSDEGNRTGQAPADHDPWLIVCRCEELYWVDIVEAIRAGARTLDEIKRLTRCGMGPCQWKGCWSTVAAMIAEETGVPLAELAPPRIRAPVRPVRLDALLTADQAAGLGAGPPED